MGSRIGLEIFNRMGNKQPKPEPIDNHGVNQNIIKVSTDIRSEVQDKHETLIVFLAVIVVLLIVIISFILYSKMAKRFRKRYSAPRPAINQ